MLSTRDTRHITTRPGDDSLRPYKKRLNKKNNHIIIKPDPAEINCILLIIFISYLFNK